MSMGEETPVGNAIVSVTGSQLGLSLGTYSVSADGNISVIVTEHDLVMTVGALQGITADANVSVTGTLITASLGNETIDVNTPVDVTGISMSASVGAATAVPGQTIVLTGMQLTGSVGTPLITAWSDVNLEVSNTWVEVDLAA